MWEGEVVSLETAFSGKMKYSGTMDMMKKNQSDMWSESREILPSEFDFWITQCPFEFQRPLRERKIVKLLHAMETGHFRPTSAIVLAHLGERVFFIDGQHRGHAAMRYGKPVEMTIIHRRVKSYEEVRYLYSGIDIGDVRHLGDVLTSMGVEQETGLSLIEQRAVAASMQLILSGFESAYFQNNLLPPHDTKVNFVKAWSKEAKEFFGIVGRGKGNYARMFRRAPVVAVALTLFRYAPDESKDFWQKVYDGKGEDNDPTKALLRYLINNDLGSKTNYSYYCKKIASAWNGYIDKDPRTNLKTTFNNAPITLNHTPYKRDKVIKGVVEEYE